VIVKKNQKISFGTLEDTSLCWLTRN